jgi:excisionase family DNA binding protein
MRLRKPTRDTKVGASLLRMGKRDGQKVAYAVVELQDARDELVAADTDLASALSKIDDAVARLDRLTAAASGLSVADAAAYLGVSQPTVRDWLKRGVLERVPDSKPVLIERSSLRQLHRLLDELRERGKDRDWLRAFVDYVHDLAVVSSPAVQRGLADIEAGRLKPA